MGVTDFNIQTLKKESQANGKFNEMRALKRQIANLQEKLEDVVDELITTVEREGKLIAWTDGEPMPYVLTVKHGERNVLDKASLAEDLGVSASSLNTVAFVELGNEQIVTPETLKEHSYKESTKQLSARKAKKSDLELIFARGAN